MIIFAILLSTLPFSTSLLNTMINVTYSVHLFQYLFIYLSDCSKSYCTCTSRGKCSITLRKVRIFGFTFLASICCDSWTTMCGTRIVAVVNRDTRVPALLFSHTLSTWMAFGQLADVDICSGFRLFVRRILLGKIVAFVVTFTSSSRGASSVKLNSGSSS